MILTSPKKCVKAPMMGAFLRSLVAEDETFVVSF